MTPAGTAMASASRDSNRLNRMALGLTTRRIHGAGTSHSAGRSRRSQATMTSSRRRSIAALTVCMART